MQLHFDIEFKFESHGYIQPLLMRVAIYGIGYTNITLQVVL